MFNNIEEYHAFLETQTQLLKNNYLSSKISQMRESTDKKEAGTKIIVRVNEAYVLIVSHVKPLGPHFSLS